MYLIYFFIFIYLTFLILLLARRKRKKIYFRVFIFLSFILIGILTLVYIYFNIDVHFYINENIQSAYIANNRFDNIRLNDDNREFTKFQKNAYELYGFIAINDYKTKKNKFYWINNYCYYVDMYKIKNVTNRNINLFILSFIFILIMIHVAMCFKFKNLNGNINIMLFFSFIFLISTLLYLNKGANLKKYSIAEIKDNEIKLCKKLLNKKNRVIDKKLIPNSLKQYKVVEVYVPEHNYNYLRIHLNTYSFLIIVETTKYLEKMNSYAQYEKISLCAYLLSYVSELKSENDFKLYRNIFLFMYMLMATIYCGLIYKNIKQK